MCRYQGRIQDFKLGGGALKKIAPSGGRREHFWGISCEKSRFYAKKSYFFQLRREARKILGYFVWKITILRQKIIFFPILGGARAGCVFLLIFTWKVKGNIFGYSYTNQTYIFFSYEIAEFRIQELFKPLFKEKWPFSWDTQVSTHCLSFIIRFSRYRFSLYVL